MKKVILSLKAYYSKFTTKIWLHTEIHTLAAVSEYITQQSKLNKPHICYLFPDIVTTFSIHKVNR